MKFRRCLLRSPTSSCLRAFLIQIIIRRIHSVNSHLRLRSQIGIYFLNFVHILIKIHRKQTQDGIHFVRKRIFCESYNFISCIVEKNGAIFKLFHLEIDREKLSIDNSRVGSRLKRFFSCFRLMGVQNREVFLDLYNYIVF